MESSVIKTRALQALLKNGLDNKSFQPTPVQVAHWKERIGVICMPRQNFDLVLVASARNVDIVLRYLPFYIRNISPKRIVLITKKSDEILEHFLPFAKDIILIDEDHVLEGLTFDCIRKLCPSTPGWYFQQFLKMSYALYCDDSHYCIMDGDTVPLRPLNFFDGDMSILLCKGEYYPPYFTMIKKLFNGKIKKATDSSFIAECMLINTSIMREIIYSIDSNTMLEGATFYKKILNAVHKNGMIGCDFSEFETYGNYSYTLYKDKFILKKIASLREAQKLFDELPPPYVLDFLSRDFDTISFESKHIEQKGWKLIDYINKCITTGASRNDLRKRERERERERERDRS